MLKINGSGFFLELEGQGAGGSFGTTGDAIAAQFRVAITV